MPEGPEVKYLVDKLNRKLKNEKIVDINIINGKYKKTPIKNLNKLHFPLTIKKISCHGKFIYWEFKNNDYIMFNTLGMSGWWIYNYYHDPNDKHNNVELQLPGDNNSVYFNDFRNFGNISFETKDKLEKKLKELGPDILSKKNEYEIFRERIERKRNDTYIAVTLLDQKVAAGCGNYLRAECLYIAKISPYRKIKDITEEEYKKIWDILRQLGWTYYNEKKGKELGIINNKYKLINKIKKSGPSKYKPEEGKFLVYRQKVDPDGNKVYSEQIGTRTIHYVKNIQN